MIAISLRSMGSHLLVSKDEPTQYDLVFTAGTVIMGNFIGYHFSHCSLYSGSGQSPARRNVSCTVYRRRCSVMLDGRSVFGLGGELKHGYTAKFKKHLTLVEIEECIVFHESPGFVSDTQPRHRLGRMGLVEGDAVDKDKFYG